MNSQDIKQFTVPLSPKVLQQRLKNNSERTGALPTVSKIKTFFQPSVTDLWRSDKSDTPVTIQHNRPSSPSTCFSASDFPALLQLEASKDLNPQLIASPTTPSTSTSTSASPTNAGIMGNGKGGRGKKGKGKSTIDDRTPTYARVTGGVLDSIPILPLTACTPTDTNAVETVNSPGSSLTPSRPTPIFAENMDSSTPSNKRSRATNDSHSPAKGQKPAKQLQLKVTDSPTSDNSFPSEQGDVPSTTPTNIDDSLATVLPSTPEAPPPIPVEESSLDPQLQRQISALIQLHTPAIIQLALSNFQSQIQPFIMETVCNLTKDNNTAIQQYNTLITTVTSQTAKTFATLGVQVSTLEARMASSVNENAQADILNTREIVESLVESKEIQRTYMKNMEKSLKDQMEGFEGKLRQTKRDMDSLQRQTDTQATNFTDLNKEIEEKFKQLRLELTSQHTTMEVDGAGMHGSAQVTAAKPAAGIDSPVESSIKSFILKGVCKLREYLSYKNSSLLKADPAAIIEKLLRHHDINSHGAVCRLSAIDIKGKESRMDTDVMLIEMTSLFQKRGATIRIREFLRKNGLLPGVQITDCYQQSEQQRARALTRLAGYMKEQGSIDAYRVNNRAGMAVLQTYKGAEDWCTHTELTEEQLLPYYTSKAEREKTISSASQHRHSSPTHPRQERDHQQQQQQPLQQQQFLQQQQQQPLPLPQRGEGMRGRGSLPKSEGAIPKSSNITSSNNTVTLRNNSSTFNNSAQRLTPEEAAEARKRDLKRTALQKQLEELNASDKAVGYKSPIAGIRNDPKNYNPKNCL